MAEFNHKEYAKQMRENCAKDYNGNIICSAELWEQIASIIESTADVAPKSEVERLRGELARANRILREIKQAYRRSNLWKLAQIIEGDEL